MAFFRPRVSREAEVRYHADQEVGKGYDDAAAKVARAEEEFLRAQAERRSLQELHAAAVAFDRALTQALRAAEAAQRATFGAKAYDDRIRRRKAKATPEGAKWTAEVDRLRTLREQHRLTGIPRLPRQVPSKARLTGAPARPAAPPERHGRAAVGVGRGGLPSGSARPVEQRAGVARVAELGQGLLLQLADALAGEARGACRSRRGCAACRRAGRSAAT